MSTKEIEFQCEYNDEYFGSLKLRAFLENLNSDEPLEYFAPCTSLWSLLLHITYLRT